MRMADSDDSAYICRRLHIIIFIMNRRSLLLVSAFVMTLSAFGVDDEGGARPILPDTSRVFDLDEVTVISQPKESYRMRMQPLSSSMYDEEQLNSLSIGDLRELSSYVPSFAMPNYGSRLTSSMYIRGIGSRVNNPAVGIYVDGVPIISKSAFNFHLYDIERVDVLRGPQGTLYGQNTEGGLVRIYTKNPMTYQGTDVRLGLGSHFYRNAEVAHYNKVNEQFAFSLAGFYNGQNGFFRNQQTGERADCFNEAGGRLRMVYQPSDVFRMDYLADYQYVRQNAFPYGVMDANGTIESPSTTYQNNYRRNIFHNALNMKVAGRGFDFYSTTSYQLLRDYMLMDQDYLPEDYMHLSQRQLQNALTQEFVFKNNSSGIWHWTAGAYGSYQWLKTEAPIYFGDGITGPIGKGIHSAMYNAMIGSFMGRFIAQGMTPEQAREAAAAFIAQRGGITMDVKMEVPGIFRTPQFNLGLFHESNIEITPNLIATLGLRYDYMQTKIDYDTEARMAMTANVMGTEATYTLTSVLKNTEKEHYNQLLPKLGLTYRFNNGNNVYALVSKGYRAGGFNMQMFSDILQTELNANSRNAMSGDYDVPHTDEDYERIAKTISYKPEVSWNYEFGTHLNLFGDAVKLDFSGFYVQIRNQQLSVMADNYGYGRMMVNAGKSYSCGVELALRGKAFDNHLSWGMNYAYTHAVFKEYTDTIEGISFTKEVVDYKDKRVPYVPEHTFSANADYRFDFLSGALKSLTLGANVYAQGKIYWNEINDLSQPFYAVLGAHADADFGKIVLSAWVKNLTDNKYSTFVVQSAISGTAYSFAQRGNPIQFGVDLKLHF